jgi:hypothetical protein
VALPLLLLLLQSILYANNETFFVDKNDFFYFVLSIPWLRFFIFDNGIQSLNQPFTPPPPK